MKTLTRDELRDLILAWLHARRRIQQAHTQAAFIAGSADLWNAERALDEAAGRLERERR